jgi:fatty-acyl-CoA synthase
VPNYGLGSWPLRRARINGVATAVRQGDRELSYAVLAERVERVAAGLAGLGVQRGDRVAYLGPNDIATFETFFATARLGAIFVPLNTRLTAIELQVLLADADPAVLVLGPQTADPSAGRARDASADASADVTVVTTDGSGPGSYDDLIAGARPHDLPEGDVALDDDLVILYTSGTTGRPKGAVLTHANLTFNTMNQLAHADVLSTDVALCTAPLFHATGLGQVSLPTMFKGGTVVVAPKFDPAWMLAAIAEQRIASFSAVPTMLQLLCDHPDFARTDLDSLRFVIYGGSMVAERVAVAWQQRGVEILQGYGMTEASPGVFLAVPDGARARPVSMGVPHFFTDVRLADLPGAADGADTGELLVRGLNVFRGYWDRPDDTAAALAGGWFHSGDVVRIEADGWGYVVDRIKDVIISGGENIYPAEVETAINALPGIVDCAVVAAPDERWGEVGLAFVVVSDPAAWDEQSLRSALTGTLAAFKVPKHVRFVADLPRTATGKVRKQQLRAAAVPPTPEESA